ncbi:MAG TPA: VOC family protein [Burkholderiales bacterium]|nr:VOC family protein [Burkholderiales bacterium]
MKKSVDRKPASSVAFLGRAMQLAFVTRDIETLLHTWTKVLGLGPFALITDNPPVNAIYRGKPTQPEILMGWTFFQNTQIAVLQQLNDAPSPQRDFIQSGREGIEHIGFWPPDPAHAARRLERMGLQQIYDIPGSATRYYEAPPGMQEHISLLEPSPARERIYRGLRAWSKDWDGKRPVRRYATMAKFWADLGVR